MNRKILMVVTSHDRIDDEHPTGLWLEEFAVPYAEFKANGLDVEVASPRGGPAPVDPRSEPQAERADEWREARETLRDTRRINEIDSYDPYDAVFLPGGHGTMFDLPDNVALQDLLSDFIAGGKPVAAICHGPAAFVNLRSADGQPFVAGKRITAFTDGEEREVELADRMPFLLESRLRELGALFVAEPNWSDHVERDGNLVTGQNPASSGSAARAVLEQLHVTKGSTEVRGPGEHVYRDRGRATISP